MTGNGQADEECHLPSTTGCTAAPTPVAGLTGPCFSDVACSYAARSCGDAVAWAVRTGQTYGCIVY
eukprot:gene7286-3114_t